MRGVTFTDDDDFPFVSVSAFYAGHGVDAFIICDYCEQVWGYTGGEAETAIGLQEDGWTQIGTMDFCPQCHGISDGNEGANDE